jgi:hypothetical protein
MAATLLLFRFIPPVWLLPTLTAVRAVYNGAARKLLSEFNFRHRLERRQRLGTHVAFLALDNLTVDADRGRLGVSLG